MHVGVGYNNKQAEYVTKDVKLECVSEEKDSGVINAKLNYAILVAGRSEAGRRPASSC